MKWFCVVWFGLQAISPSAHAQSSARSVGEQLTQISLDPKQTFRVRDLQLFRGDIKIYLNEGVLGFLTPLSGKTVAAVFATQPVEAGDAEVIVLPPQRNERAALASFTKTPNLDEHFDSALFLFSDDTAKELLAAIQQTPVHNLPEIASQLAPAAHALIQGIGGDMRGALVTSVLDQHDPEHGFFYALVGGRSLGRFDLEYNPENLEQITLGRAGLPSADERGFQLWTSFRPRHSGPYQRPAPSISDYQIQTEIHPDLSLTANARFNLQASKANGRVIPLFISPMFKVDSAQVDGRAAEVFQPSLRQANRADRASAFFLIVDTPLTPDSRHQIEVRYGGSVVHRTKTGTYAVDDRNEWYPFTLPTHATFDLTFRCPANLRLVSTGELISDTTDGDIRTVHRLTRVPEALAGFNLGEYAFASDDHGAYRIECYSNRATESSMTDIPRQLGALLDYYTKRWLPLPIHTVAISPVPAYFGQGFPGLIYLSDVSYIRPEDRPLQLRSAVLDQFFTELLLPHEVAHQWWGNMVTAGDYRSAWIMEALANYSALQFVEKNHGRAAANAVLDVYRADLSREVRGKAAESYGPLEFGVRVSDLASEPVWHTITYEKGTWAMHMLHERLGDEGFLKLEIRLLHDFANRPITNEDFRQAASRFVPAGQPDKNLSLFFDTWIYGTGVPKLQLQHQDVTMSDVDDDFSVDIPLRCRTKGAPDRTRWVRLSSGSNALELPPGTVCELPPTSDFLYR